MKHIHATILAAGASTRFESPYTKLIAPICGKPMIRYPVDTLRELNIPMSLVVGYHASYIQNTMPDDPHITYAYQEEQRGTGHALLCGYTQCSARHILVLNGDTPLITSELIRSVIHTHTNHKAAITFVTADNQAAAHAYGKVVRNGNHIEIVEARHAHYPVSSYRMINAGIYLFNRAFLDEALDHLMPHTQSNEIYITDLIGYASEHGYTVTTVHEDFDTIQGINTLDELYHAEQCKHNSIMQHLRSHGVYCRDPYNTYVDSTASIAQHCRIEPGAMIHGNSYIGPRCHIGAYAIINNCTIEHDVCIAPYSHITDTTIEAESHIGPFARIRKQSYIHTKATIGNFAEVSASTIASHAQTKHMSYIGNTTVGEHTNIGAGTVICNYDGYMKHNTTIDDHTFIGSNTTLIAPLSIGAEAIIGAGSVISKNIPRQALAIARERETIKEEYAPYIRNKQQYSHIEHRNTHHDAEKEHV